MNAPPIHQKEFVTGLIEVMSTGLTQQRIDDAHILLDAIKALRPHMQELEIFEAWIAMRRTDWPKAMEVLKEVDASSPQFEGSQALMAFCEFAVGNTDWTQRAHSLLNSNSSPDAVRLMQLMLHPDAESSPPADEKAPPQDQGALHAALFSRA